MTGSCACGAVVYEVERLLTPILHCHCETCRKSHAAPFASTAGVLREHFRYLQGEERLSSFESSPGKRRFFCSGCGSHIVSVRDGQPHVTLRVATLDEDPGARPQGHIFMEEAIVWLEDTGNLPHYPGFPPK